MTSSFSQPDNWVNYAAECEKCGHKRRAGESFGGVYARGRRMAVCFTCYTLISQIPQEYGAQVARYRKKGIA